LKVGLISFRCVFSFVLQRTRLSSSSSMIHVFAYDRHRDSLWDFFSVFCLATSKPICCQIHSKRFYSNYPIKSICDHRLNEWDSFKCHFDTSTVPVTSLISRSSPSSSSMQPCARIRSKKYNVLCWTKCKRSASY